MKTSSAISMLVFVFVISSVMFTRAELFTALVDLERLLFTEGEIVRTLEKYLAVEEERLEKVKRLMEEYERHYLSATEDAQTFLSNPVNAYLLVKRLTADWKIAEYLTDSSGSKALVENITQHNLEFPDEEDLTGAAAALMRLQDTYLLDTATLARGHIEGTKPSPQLSAGDCFELGRQAYNAQDYRHTLLWMQEAYDRLELEEVETAVKADILEYMSYSSYMQGNVRHALKLTHDLLRIDPDHPRAYGNRGYYQDALSNIESQKRGDDGEMPYEKEIAPKQSSFHSFPEHEAYESLCRGENLKTPAQESQLHCRYFTNDNPLLLLQPVKEEELNLKPRLVVYHNILSNSEIEVVKQLAQPRLRRATVQNSKSGELEVASYRISKSAWLKDDEHAVVRRISRRIESITGLTLNTSEELQVVNYGIGGHYDPHFDFARKDEVRAFESLGTGNRIATWLNYMSDVDAGGATVFPSIGVQVRPEKGAAAFWFNLFQNGEGDTDTRHAACPVLAGSKWVSNKWMHERGQEFRRQCAIDPVK